MKQCIACSMPMERSEDFAGGDLKKDYCCHCAKEDGSMKSYEEILQDSIPFVLENYQVMGFETRPTEEQARKALIAHMATLSAWKDRK